MCEIHVLSLLFFFSLPFWEGKWYQIVIILGRMDLEGEKGDDSTLYSTHQNTIGY